MAGDAKFQIDIMGGLNQGADPTDVADNEFVTLYNWYPYAGRLRRRHGISRVSGPSGNYTEDITNAFAYTQSTGTWTLIVGGKTTIGKLSGSSLVAIPQTSQAFLTSNTHWSFEQYKNIVYAARAGLGTLQRCDGDVVSDAGIAAPTTAPSTADGGSGNLTDGDYISVVTFYNSVTGAESDASPNTSTLALSGTKQIAWTDIPTSTNPQVNARRLYRTLVDAQGEYYFVGQINDNLQTTFTDNVIQSAQGGNLLQENAEPPVGLKFIEIFQERMWGSDGTDLYFSGIGLPESWYALDIISVSPDDGHNMTGILAFGDRLLIGKTNQVATLTGTDASTFVLQNLTNAHGVYSHASMKESESFAFWFGGDNFYQTDGNVVRAIGDIKIRDYVDGIDELYYDLVIAAIDASRSWYIACIPYNSTVLNTMLVFNYKEETWAAFDMRGEGGNLTCPQWIADFFDTNGKHIIYCNLGDGGEDDVYEFNDSTANEDVGISIECRAQTKFFAGTNKDFLKYMKNCFMQTTSTTETMVADLVDETGTSVKTASVLVSGSPWKKFPLANNGKPLTSMSIQFTHIGTKPIDILGYMFQLVDTGRGVPISVTA